MATRRNDDPRRALRRTEDPRGAARSSADPRRPAHRLLKRPDPSFLRRLEDDSLWDANERARPMRSRPPRRDKRSRLLAIIALVAAAVIILITGLTAGSADSGAGGGRSVPFSLLPLSSSVVTSTSAP